MIPSYVTHILPGIPAKLGTGDYAITTLHAIVGAAATLLGVFVVLRAYRLVPERLRFKNYKKFMRTSYVMYLVAAFLGVAVYLIVYVGGFLKADFSSRQIARDRRGRGIRERKNRFPRIIPVAPVPAFTGGECSFSWHRAARLELSLPRSELAQPSCG